MLATRLVKRFKCAAPAVKSGRNAKTLRTAPAPSARSTVVSRSFLGSELIRGRTNSNKEYVENPKGVPSSQYHRTSTRYTNTTPELLQILSAKDTIPHRPPQGLMDNVVDRIVRFLRVASDAYFKDDLIYRAMMLETVAAVPGMVGGMMHHLRSLRRVENDNWIRTLLDEAENERIHLFCWLDVLRPTWSQKWLIISVQAIFFTGFLGAYILFPKSCHRFVGYLEEEAFKTYTHLLEFIDSGKIKDRPAPKLAIDYWNMPEGSTMRDMTVIIREDEADHARVNHSMANMITSLRKRDIVYTDVTIDDSVFETVPGTHIVPGGTVEAISKVTKQAENKL